MSIAWPFAEGSSEPTSIELSAAGFPAPCHPAEADMFCRQAAMPGHSQGAIEAAHVGVIGAGGLGSWIALGLARMGVRRLTIVDPDRFDRTNAPRQLMLGPDMGTFKAHALARNILQHMTNPGTVGAMAVPFTHTLLPYNDTVDAPYRVTLLVVGVDNNRCRLEAAEWGRANMVPVVFSMLSLDGLRAQVFLQRPSGACLLCALPNLKADVIAPCAAASMASCMMAAAHALELCVAAVADDRRIPTWRETSVDGSTERAGSPRARADCPGCSLPQTG